ncbi:uncharacterized protein [Miscanthus floridulus]|uniref:uncharacterized protein n=1 Tax=Miscanthus floridulus TaxID=154761 RepID=UPI00345AF587
MGRGTLDHLPDVKGTVLGASASSPAFPGGGGEDALGLAISCPGAEADMPEAWALGKRAVSSVGSTVEVEQAAGEGNPTASAEGRGGAGVRRGPAVTDEHGGHATAAATVVVEDEGRGAEAVVSPVEHLVFSRKCHAEAPALAPRKALKVSTSSITQWVVEAQAAIQRGAASVRADPKEPIAQGEATGAAMEQAEEEEPTPHEVEARGSDEAKAPSVAEATEVEAEAIRTFEAGATEAGASRTTEPKVAGAGALGTTKAEVAKAGMGTVEPAAQEAKMKAAQAMVPPQVQGPPPSRESA